MVSVIEPYSCRFVEYVVHKQNGVIVPYATYMFPVPLFKISASLSYVLHFTCVTCESVYSTHVIYLIFVVCLWFCTVLYCVCAFECNIYVGMFDEIGGFSNLWTGQP
jgi:hypothetical protein